MKKRIFSIFTAFALLFSTLPVNALAVGNADAGGLCEHHPSHTAECGYTEGAEGTPCNHEHTEDCYTLVENCVHEHGPECYPADSVSDNTATPSDAEDREPTECTHVCSEDTGCIKEKLDCQHEHDDECGYIPATEGTPCTFVCEDCGEESTEPEETAKPEEAKCRCDSLCTGENVNADCPVCGAEDADLTLCKGEPAQAQNITITGFDELPEEVRAQIIPTKTKLADLNLPDTLGASGYVGTQDSGGAEPLTIEGVEWESDPAYDENAGQGAWMFTAKLPEGYILPDGVELPQIGVMAEPVNLLADEETHNINTDGSITIRNTCIADCSHTITGDGNKTGNTITVTGGTHNIIIENVNISSGCAFSIEGSATVNLTLKETNVLQSTSTGRAGLQVADDATLVITQKSTGSLETTGGTGGAGIGGGYAGMYGDGTGGSITIEGGDIKATGGRYAAGIGGGAYGCGDTITITGGNITAVGGTESAGIGGGSGEAGGNITISGGLVHATGTSGGAGIGDGGSAGSSTSNSSFSTGDYGNAVIFASSITQSDDTTSWNGVIFRNNIGSVYAAGSEKTVITDVDFEIPEGATLTVPKGVTLTNNGNIKGEGKIVVKGKLDGSGSQTVTVTRPEGSGATPDCDISKDGTDILTLNDNITTSGNYYLSGELMKSAPLIIAGSGTDTTVVNLCLHGHSLSSSYQGVVIVQNATLNLYDCQGTGTITGGYATREYVNTGTSGVQMSGGGIHADRAVINLYGGSIIGNTSSMSQGYAGGGGIYLADSTLTIYDGASVSNNVGPAGGIFVDYSDVVMEGGSISGNRSNISRTTFPCGGGINLSGGATRDGRFTMKGGEISNNTAPTGGGIYVYNQGKKEEPILVLTGGKITNNNAESSDEGGGIYFGRNAGASKIGIQGSPYIYGNTNKDGKESNITNQNDARLFTLTGALNQGAMIGFDLSNGVGTTLVEGWNEYMNGKTISDFFVCDQEGMGLTLGERDGEIILSLTHSITVQDDGNGTASASLASAAERITITLTATPNPGYHFKEWQVISGGATISGNSFNMPASDVTVKAIFEKEIGPELPTHTHSWGADWNHDSARHWHECMNTGCDITDNSKKNGYGAHDFSAGDACKICGYERGTQPPEKEYPVTVNGSHAAVSGEGSYQAGITVSIDAGSRSNYCFNGWTSSDGITFANVGSSRTTFTMPGKDVTVTAHWKYIGSGSGSGGNTGGVSSGGSSSGGNSDGGSTIIDCPTEKRPDIPATGQSKPVTPDKDEHVTIYVALVQDAIGKANTDANKNGNKENGIAVTVPVDNKADAQSLVITISAETLDKLVATKVRRFDITTNGLPCFSFTLGTLKMLDEQSLGGDLILRLTRATVTSKQAKEAVGSRPVYDITLVFVKDGKETPFTDWQGMTVSVKLPYTPAKEEQTGNLYAVYVDAKGKVEWLTKSSYNANQKAVIFEAGHFSIYGVGYKDPAPVFTDITGHWAADNIIFAASRGLLAGTGDNRFSPNTGMTRGMFVTALGRLAGIDPESYKTGKFTDVKADAYYAPYVNWAAEKGIVSGTSATTFSPDTNITREQMAVIMASYAEKMGYDLPVAHEAVTFADNAQIRSWAAKEVKAMQQAGIMAGKGGNRFDPKGTATRAEVATVLRRFVEIVIDPQAAQGWMQDHSGSWQYRKDGKAVTGWLYDDKKWYWLDNGGWMFASGWKQIDGKWYYFYSDGSMAVNTTIDGHTVGPDGVRLK